MDTLYAILPLPELTLQPPSKDDIFRRNSPLYRESMSSTFDKQSPDLFVKAFSPYTGKYY
jgi:hypothetical protein